MKRKFIILGSVLVLIAILIVIARFRGTDALQVEVVQPEQRTIIQTVSANGKIQPQTDIKISADVSGEITELYVEEGDTVKEGQLLARIWPELYLSAVDRSTAALNNARVSLKTSEIAVTQAQSRFSQAENDYERNKKLYDQKVISKAEMDAFTATFEVAREELRASKERVMAARFGVQSAEATQKEARENLSRTSLYAPASGVISRLNIEKGEKVVGTAQMAGTELMVISNFNQMEVIVEVNENDILSISKGDTASIEVDAYGTRQFKGIVTGIAKSAMTKAGTSGTTEVANFEVKVLILQSSYSDLLGISATPFLPGLSASVDIQTERKDKVWSLPIECVTTRSISETGSNPEESDEVIFIADNGKAKKMLVQTGIQDSRYIEIISEMKDNWAVISGPYDALSKKLNEGDAIEYQSIPVKKDKAPKGK